MLQNLTLGALLAPVSAANTAAATSGNGAWMDTQQIEGDILITQNVGAITGSIAGKLQVADDANGTNAADVSGATFTSANAAGVQSITVRAKGLAKRYLGYVGTITTGPALVSVTATGRPKTS